MPYGISYQAVQASFTSAGSRCPLQIKNSFSLLLMAPIFSRLSLMVSAKQIPRTTSYWLFFQHRACQASPAAMKEKEYSPAIWEACREGGAPGSKGRGLCNLRLKHVVCPPLAGDSLYLAVSPRRALQGAEAQSSLFQLSHYVARNRDPLGPPQEKGCLDWNWEAAEDKGSSRAGCPSEHVGFLFPSLSFFRFHVVFFNHIFGCCATSVCHGFSSQMAPFLVSASGKT